VLQEECCVGLPAAVSGGSITKGVLACVQRVQTGCYLGRMVDVACVGFGDKQLAEVWHAPAKTGFDSQDHLRSASTAVSRLAGS
jgi:hypothetical protein